MLSKTHTKYIQRISHKKFRDESNLFIAEGPKVVLDLLTGQQFICKELFAVKGWLQEQDKLIKTLAGIEVAEVEEFELKKISSLSTSHNVLAVFKKRQPVTDFSLEGNITLALDCIQDPGNLGTIIRIADWFGVKNMVCAVGTADMYNPKVVQSTMGSLGRVNIVYTDLPEWIKNNSGTKIYSASLNGKDVKQVGKIKEGVIVIGNEANGVTGEVQELVSERITIPKTGDAESLNAAVAAGIILSHLV